MSDGYSGPWCNVKVATGDTYSVRGDHARVISQLREHEGGLAELRNVHGDAIMIAPVHVVSIEQMPMDWSVQD